MFLGHLLLSCYPSQSPPLSTQSLSSSHTSILGDIYLSPFTNGVLVRATADPLSQPTLGLSPSSNARNEMRLWQISTLAARLEVLGVRGSGRAMASSQRLSELPPCSQSSGSGLLCGAVLDVVSRCEKMFRNLAGRQATR